MLWAVGISENRESRNFESGLREFKVCSVIVQTHMIWDSSINLAKYYFPLIIGIVISTKAVGMVVLVEHCVICLS